VISVRVTIFSDKKNLVVWQVGANFLSNPLLV